MQMPREIGTFHIIGIGGIGMSAIAEILLAKGYSVQGSDQKDSANVRRLRAKGVRVFIGHDAINLVGARSIVISTAVKAGNPELEAARAKGLPVIRRAEMLAELMRLYSTVSVTGTHGKTTTTSLIAHIFTAAGVDPTVISGGIIQDWGTNARLGKGEWMIVEADESDGTFVRLPTQIGIVTNIDPEHLDYFKSVENMHREFETFFRNIPFYGLAVTCIDHPVARDMVERLELRRDGRRLLTYGTTRGADLVLRGLTQERGGIVIDADLGAARARRRAADPRLVCPHSRPAQCAQRAGRHRGGERSRHRRQRHPLGSGDLHRRQAPLRADRRLERRLDLRRLCASSGGDLRRARGGACRRPRPRRRRVRAAPLLARARSLRRILRLLPRCRQRHRGTALFGRRAADPGHRSALHGRGHPLRRAPGGHGHRQRARSAAAAAPPRARQATWSSASAPAPRPSGRMRCPIGSPPKSRDAPTRYSSRHPGHLGGATLTFPDLSADLQAKLPELRGRIAAGTKLADITWFRVGGPAQALFSPADEADLAYFLAGIPADLPVTVIGLGSNLLVRDGGVPGVVIRLGKGFADGHSPSPATASAPARRCPT